VALAGPGRSLSVTVACHSVDCFSNDAVPAHPRARRSCAKACRTFAPAYDRATVTFDQIAQSGILCVECKACASSTVTMARTSKVSFRSSPANAAHRIHLSPN